jgi:hypothetical protein
MNSLRKAASAIETAVTATPTTTDTKETMPYDLWRLTAIPTTSFIRAERVAHHVLQALDMLKYIQRIECTRIFSDRPTVNDGSTGYM